MHPREKLVIFPDEPTDEMLKAAMQQFSFALKVGPPEYDGNDAVEMACQALIDAAPAADPKIVSSIKLGYLIDLWMRTSDEGRENLLDTAEVMASQFKRKDNTV